MLSGSYKVYMHFSWSRYHEDRCVAAKTSPRYDTSLSAKTLRMRVIGEIKYE